MKKIKIFDPEDQLNDYSQYLLLEYRQKLLRVLLFMCFGIIAVLTVVNLIEWVRDPLAEWGTYNLISDGIALGILLFLYQANRKGFVSLAGWLFGLIVISTIPISYPVSSINQTFLILALPVAISSFVIQPWASFIFACLVLIFYNFTLLQYPDAFQYDMYSLLAVCMLAVGSYLISSILNKAISDAVRAYDETIQGWAKALEMRDSETMGHSQRIVELTLLLARELGVKGIDLFHIRRGALLHDIGKMGIPDAILHKPGRLSDEEWIIMRKHPVYARDYLSRVAYLASALDIPYSHHEKWDGTGYPQGLKGGQIPIAARIFAVVDVWDALTSQRSYMETWSKEQALAYIQEQAGRQFDPRVVDAFIDLVKSKFEIQRSEDTHEDSVRDAKKTAIQVDSQRTIPR
ncbi:MAG: HD domain-containing protein [Chloroflexi bacterium]|nr:MAG: HD domain-containing protein [Chloroflexota bacterium]